MNLLFALILFPLNSPAGLYGVLVVVLILSGLGLPVPEEVTLLLGGYLAYLGFLNLFTTFLVLGLGIIVADAGGYMIGRLAGGLVETHILSRWRLTRSLLERGKQAFERYGEKVVVFSRPFSGIRVIVPMLAGYTHMNFAKFLLYDTLVAVPWTLLLVSVSYYLGSGFSLIVELRALRHILFVVAAGFFLVMLVRFAWRKTKVFGS